MNIHTSRLRGHVRRVAIGVGVLSLVPLGLSTAQAGSTVAPAAAGTTLYSVDLDSGAAAEIGSVGTGRQLVGLAIAPDVGNVYGLTDVGELVTFSVDDLTAVTTAQITGPDCRRSDRRPRPSSGGRQHRRSDRGRGRLHHRPLHRRRDTRWTGDRSGARVSGIRLRLQPHRRPHPSRCQHRAEPAPQPRHWGHWDESRHRCTDDRWPAGLR